MLLRDYFNSLNFYRNGELSRNQIGRSGVQVKKENEKFTVVRSHSTQNLNCGHLTLLFCRGRQRNVPKCTRTCRAIVFAHKTYFFAALSLPSPSSLLKLPNRELKQRRRQRQRKRHLKIYLYFICATSRLF